MEPIEVLGAELVRLVAGRSTPLLVAIDGRSGTGKSTLAQAIGQTPPTGLGLPAVAVIDGDDFYAGGTAQEWDRRSAAEKVAEGIAWWRQRPVLEALRRGETARWHPFDWDAFDGRLSLVAETCAPAPIVILEGAYSARPELADLLDLRVLYEVPDGLRRQRLIAREGLDYADDWWSRWEEAELLYFGSIMPPEAFDLVL